MKKMKLLSFAAFLLALLTLLVSCGGTGAGTVKVADLLDGKATADAALYGNFREVTGLDGVLLRAHHGDLYYFVADASTGTKHIVYNAATDKVLTTKTNYYNEEFSVVLLSDEDGRTGEASLSAYVLTSRYLVSDETSHATITLFSADGTEVARRRYEKEEVAAGMPTPYEAALDLGWRILAESFDRTPGTIFCYTSLATYMLSAIVQKVTGEKVVDYLQPRLFEPLGITDVHWEESPEGITTGG